MYGMLRFVLNILLIWIPLTFGNKSSLHPIVDCLCQKRFYLEIACVDQIWHSPIYTEELRTAVLFKHVTA